MLHGTRKTSQWLILLALVVSAPWALAQTPADDAVVQAMNEAIQDEYRSHQTYQKVIATFGAVRPFSNIVEAEARHIQALSQLFVRRDLPVPKSRWSHENVPTFETVRAACEGGVSAEKENIALYDRLLAIELPLDVREVFENLRSASLENHLPAFRRCADGT